MHAGLKDPSLVYLFILIYGTEYERNLLQFLTHVTNRGLYIVRTSLWRFVTMILFRVVQGFILLELADQQSTGFIIYFCTPVASTYGTCSA